MNNDNYNELKQQFIHTAQQLVKYGRIISPEYAGLMDFDSCENIQVLVEFIICSYLKAPEEDIKEALTKEKTVNALRVVWQTHVKNKYAASETDVSDLRKTMTALQEQINSMKEVMVTQNELEHGLASMFSAETAEGTDTMEYVKIPKKALTGVGKTTLRHTEEAHADDLTPVAASTDASGAEPPEAIEKTDAPSGEEFSRHPTVEVPDPPPAEIPVPESAVPKDDQSKEPDAEKPQERGSQINFNGNLVAYISRLKRKGFDADQIDFFLECIRDGYTMKQIKAWERKDWSVPVLRRLREIYEEKQRQKKIKKRKKG